MTKGFPGFSRWSQPDHAIVGTSLYDSPTARSGSASARDCCTAVASLQAGSRCPWVGAAGGVRGRAPVAPLARGVPQRLARRPGKIELRPVPPHGEPRADADGVRAHAVVVDVVLPLRRAVGKPAQRLAHASFAVI